MKAVDLLIDSLLPEELQGTVKDMDSKSLDALMSAIATRYPEKYESISKGIADAGRNASYLQGETITLNDMRPTFDKDNMLKAMDRELDTARRSNPETFPQTRAKIWDKYNQMIENMTMQSARESGNNLAYSVSSGARGKPAQLKAMLSTPGYYVDYKGDQIPLFVRNSFGQGLRPAEFLAGTYGARTSVLSTKNSTARGGDFSKQLSQSAATTVVTARDCGVNNGIDLNTNDASMRGRVLAKDTAGVPAGTILDKHALGKIRRNNDTAVVRSPLTCQAKEGVCAKCVGEFHNQKLPEVGDAVGITAAQSIGEPVTQGALNCLAEGTEVLMADFSIKNIEEIMVGDSVMCADISGNTFPTKVTHTWDQGLQPVQRRTYRIGSSKQELYLDSTSEHVVLSNRKTYGLKQGKMNSLPEKLVAGYPHKNLAAVMPVTNKVSGIREPWAAFLGVYLGDGIRWNSSNESWPTISCADLSEIEDLNEVLRPLNVQCLKNKRSHDWRVVMLEDELSDYRNRELGTVVKGVRSPVKKKLLEMGLANVYALDKRVPKSVWSWDIESVSDLVAGFVAADGSVYENKDGHLGVSFASTSKGMLEDLKTLLARRLCVYSTGVTRTGRAGQGCRKNDQYQFTVTRLDQVCKLAEFIGSRLPGVKRARLERLMRDIRFKPQYTDFFVRAGRKETTELGRVQCYDITVQHEDSLFVLANGIIVSNSKHTGGMASGKREYSGFDVINQLVQSPEVFPDRATVAEEDGRIETITEAPQGGYYIKLNGKDHYVPSGYEVTAKVGDRVEAGDQLSDGIVDPEDVMRLRGLGSGRRYYAERLNKALSDSGMAVDRRNVELVARGAFDHVKISDDEDMPGYLPDDVVSYNRLTSSAIPARDAKGKRPLDAVGKFLATPALHYSIGTKITPRMAERLAKARIGNINVSDKEPNFKPISVRLRTAAHSNPDWLASMSTSYLKTQLEHAAVRGDETNVNSNIHYGPRLAKGTGFGQDVAQTGKF